MVIASLAPSRNNGITYSLDLVGNRTSESSSLPDILSGSFSFNADDELSSETYDPNGNVTAEGGKTFTYDSQNEMLSMTATGKSVGMVYDGDGNRVAKTVNGVTTLYLVDDLNPTGYAQVVEELTNGAASRTYTYGLQRISEYQPISNVWTPSYYGYDGGGNVRNLTNSAGAITDTYEYDAYGNEFTVSGTTPNEMMYRGEQYDSDLGLYYLRARYYNPATGRFMSRDPLDGLPWDPTTLHKYLYVGSNPVNNVDPRGKDLFEFAIRTSAEIPEAKLIDIYGCVADAGLAAIDLILDKDVGYSNALGSASAVIGCVTLTPGMGELAEQGKLIAKSAEFARDATGWGACALDAEGVINGLNSLVSGSPDGDAISESLESLGGCVSDLLGKMLKAEE